MINNSISAGQPSPPSAESETPADGRTHSMHVLYVAAHEVTVGLAEHAATVTEQLRRDSLRKIPSRARVDSGEPDAARAMISRLDVFEQIAGHFSLSDPTSGRRVNP